MLVSSDSFEDVHKSVHVGIAIVDTAVGFRYLLAMVGGKVEDSCVTLKVMWLATSHPIGVGRSNRCSYSHTIRTSPQKQTSERYFVLPSPVCSRER